MINPVEAFVELRIGYAVEALCDNYLENCWQVFVGDSFEEAEAFINDNVKNEDGDFEASFYEERYNSWLVTNFFDDCCATFVDDIDSKLDVREIRIREIIFVVINDKYFLLDEFTPNKTKYIH